MNINNLVILKEPQFVVKQTHENCLKIREGYRSENILHTLFILMFLFLAVFVSIISTIEQTPKEFFQSWYFMVLLGMAFLLLFYVWYKGYVKFDNDSRTITIKLYEKKFFGRVQIAYQYMAGVRVDVIERMTQSRKIYLIYRFSVQLKSGDSKKLLTVHRKKHGRIIKQAIANHLGIEISERREYFEY